MKALKIISDILPIPGYSIILICFFLPFFTIKCGTTDLVSLSGFDYIIMNDAKSKMKDSPFAKELEKKMGADSLFGIDTEKEKEEDNLYGDETDELNNDVADSSEEKATETPIPADTEDEKRAKILMFVLMSIPFLMAISGLIFSFVKSRYKKILHIVFASIGFLTLLIYGFIIKASNSEIGAAASAMESFGGMISIELGTAYYIAISLFLVLLIFFSVEKYIRNTYLKEQQIRNTNQDEIFPSDVI
ncbi:hypothetical protein GV828_11860 [Flavobacterium sp. NST-5]|uniref:ABC transporter permease n=1 Tax=Flavobacterium ichthyis TaxID=2698827 RepID=A0ABW9ZAH2_9FLAO|nr:hypothetical protein [Flavobacterium ichthyis]NBL65897.1 hypothetical protein [Flavobacterium ichthyis]